MNLLTPRFRVSFPHLFEKKAAAPGGKEKYSLSMLFSKSGIRDDPEEAKLFKMMKVAVKTAALEFWGSEEKIPENFQDPFKQGTTKEQYDGYDDDIIFINAGSQTRPGVVDQGRVPILEASELYGGCYAHATVNTYAWKYMGNNGVSFGLNNVQKLDEGDAFGGRTNPDQDFDILTAPTTSTTEESISVDDDLFS